MESTMENSSQRRRKGQTLAEFALTLPILLILLFGIIEFGRIFQAWVTLQNSARAAARYASTGIFNEERYPLDDDPNGEATGMVPCVNDAVDYGGADQRGTRTMIDPNATPGNPGDDVQIYQGGRESIFATWYGGLNCDPSDITHQAFRKDIARVLSTFDEARVGAAGLSLEAPVAWNFSNISGTPLYEVWRQPMPRSTQRSWFNVMICSSRPRMDAESTTYFDRGASDIDTRFVTYLGEDELRDPAGNVLTNLPEPSCLSNEIPTATAIAGGATDNSSIPWLDPGGPGDGISIVVSFNHPLITPLGLADYIPLQARRVAINESFRASRAVNALAAGGGITGAVDTPIPSDTPTRTNTPTSTNTGTATPLATATPTTTPTQPFTCNLITVGNLTFSQNRVQFLITNNNPQNSSLVRVTLGWSKPAAFTNMYVAQMAINNQVHWLGNDSTPPTNSGPGGVGPEPGDQASADRTVYGLDDSTWQAVFGNGPAQLSQYLTASNFTPTEFVFQDPGTGGTCVKTFIAPTPTRTPTLSGSVTATRTPTPDCTNRPTVNFQTFMSFGVVRMLITNNRNLPVVLTGFNINWNKRNPAMVLEQVTVGGNNPSDPLTTRVWNHSPGDATPPTNSASEGSWQTNYTVDAGASVSLFIDFGGTTSTLSNAWGVQAADFNLSTYNFNSAPCGNTTVTAGSQNTPTPPPPPGPTNTATNTFTPGPTSPPPVPTNTPVPGPAPTNTPIPPTNPPPPPPSNTPPPTVPGSGPSD
jgi:hypothetical protein